MSRDTIIECLKAHAQGMIAKHRANVELDSVAKYNDRLEMINKYIKDHDPSLNN